MTTRPKRAPAGLGQRGRQLWKHVTAAYELSAPETELLVEACRSADLCEQLQELVDQGGLTSIGSKGEARANPLLTELRAARLVLLRVLASLDLPDDAGEPTVLPTRTVGGRAGARARWSRPIRDLHGPAEWLGGNRSPSAPAIRSHPSWPTST
jgi:hypothetical protein